MKDKKKQVQAWTKKQKKVSDKEMGELAYFLYWRWRYYSMEYEWKDLLDGENRKVNN
jgi:hypothetical protein